MSDSTQTDSAPAEHAAAPGGDGDAAETGTVQELEARLRERDELVAALTARLEQAAEKLDRIHRTGGNRGLRTGGGFPPELVKEHKGLVDNLQRAVEQWDDMQAAATLGRLEIQITDLRDLVAGRVLDGGGGFSHTDSVRGDQPMSADDSGRTTQSEPAATPADSKPTGYEALKASLLAAEGGEPEASHAIDGTASPEPADDLSAIAMDAVMAEVAQEDPPQPIDLEHADSDAISTAINDRDAYIAYLIRELRVAESDLLVPPDWEALDQVPEELREALEELQERLQQTLRIAEVENSLERARLGREEARLKQLEEQIQKARKRLGLADGDEPTEQNDPSDDGDEAGSTGSRWARMLGRRGRDE